MRSEFYPGAAAEAATVTGPLEARQTEKLGAPFRLRLVLRRLRRRVGDVLQLRGAERVGQGDGLGQQRLAGGQAGFVPRCLKEHQGHRDVVPGEGP
ncbi:hypothetical protein [Streptomyces sp. NPDC001480]|uniref:hypothetical protein n=1 Tax=Streptomyces sp. NPDC001480 TaxID=3364577 RepID=UPI00369CC7B7